MSEIKRVPIVVSKEESNVHKFHNEMFGDLTIIWIEDKPWFIASECAKKLGYVNPHDAISKHCKGVAKRETLTNGGKQMVNTIPEGYLYRLIARSKLPEAEKFESWVFDEVIPSIRKYGAYLTPEVIEKTLTNPDFIIGLATQLKYAQKKNKELNSQIEELTPKAEYTDEVLKSKSVFSTRNIANEYDMTAQQLNKLLVKYKVIYRSKNGIYYCLYREYRGHGYTGSVTVKYEKADGTIGTKVNISWTQAGRKFIHDLLAEHDILPVQERNSKLGLLVEQFLEEKG